MSKQSFRKLQPRDMNRIDCSALGCEKSATHCNTVEWNSGNTEGISFFYFCNLHIEMVKKTGRAY